MVNKLFSIVAHVANYRSVMINWIENIQKNIFVQNLYGLHFVIMLDLLADSFECIYYVYLGYNLGKWLCASLALKVSKISL